MYEIFSKLMKANGCTAYQVSKATGIAQSTLSDWKSGKSISKADKIQKIADYFGVSAEYLMTGKEKEDGPRYYINDETAAIAQDIFENKELRLLFDAARDAEPEDTRGLHMSIKGTTKELFIGKSEIVIKDRGYKLQKIPYEDMSKIEYCFRAVTEGGYIDFHDTYGHFERFCFPRKSNDAIRRAVEYIGGNVPELNIIKHDLDQDPFYAKNIFIAILAIFCSWPIAIILYWCTGKRTFGERMLFTVVIIAFQAAIFLFWQWYAAMQVNQAMNEINNYMNQLLY